MGRHSHQLVEAYSGPLAFGLSRELDEVSFTVFLQKFSDDRFLEVLRARLSDEEMERTVDWLTGLMKRHLSEEEYHTLFLKDE